MENPQLKIMLSTNTPTQYSVLQLHHHILPNPLIITILIPSLFPLLLSPFSSSTLKNLHQVLPFNIPIILNNIQNNIQTTQHHAQRRGRRCGGYSKDAMAEMQVWGKQEAGWSWDAMLGASQGFGFGVAIVLFVYWGCKLWVLRGQVLPLWVLPFFFCRCNRYEC